VRRLPLLAVVASLLLAAALAELPSQAAQADKCQASPKTNRQIVLDFYKLGLVGLQPRAAFERYVSPDFIEHKPDVEGGTREAAAAYLETLIKNVPKPRWDILRTVAEGDFVFLHARFTPAPDAPAYAVADLFRLEGCRIVEHWDVVASPPAKQINPNPRF
jgi:predicted SnoaL-like aldol condensation-catalyzing enzyme